MDTAAATVTTATHHQNPESQLDQMYSIWARYGFVPDPDLDEITSGWDEEELHYLHDCNENTFNADVFEFWNARHADS